MNLNLKIEKKMNGSNPVLKLLNFAWGDAFAALTNFTKNFSGNDVFPSPKLNEDKKKRSSPEIEVIFPRNQVKT